MSHLADGAGRGGRYHHGVGPESKVNMAMPFARVGRKKLADYGLSRQRRERHRSDKLPRARSHNDLNLSPGLDKQPSQHGALIGCYPARYAKYDVFAANHLPASFDLV